jgi:hypothetical protein
MVEKPSSERLEELIVHDPRSSFTLVSFLAVTAIFINLNSANLPALGAIASIFYLFINGVFLGHAFFEEGEFILKLLLGSLLLLSLLGLFSWAAVVVSNLGVVSVVIVLLAVAALSSLVNRFVSKSKEK